MQILQAGNIKKNKKKKTRGGANGRVLYGQKSFRGEEEDESVVAKYISHEEKPAC